MAPLDLATNSILGGSGRPDTGAFAARDIEQLQHVYRTASPFPHLVIDQLFPDAMLDQVEASFDMVPPGDWLVYNHALQTKRATRTNGALPGPAQRYFDYIYSGPFLRLLSEITGIENLIPDPSLSGGGLHEIGPGGRFDVHVDFQKHPVTGLDNRLVLITYLNRGWRPDYGGALELWEQNPAACAAEIVPVFGRTLIMEESSRGAHGHPDPVAAGQRRRSVAAYYYTNGREDGLSDGGLTTRYVKRGGRTRRQRLELLVKQLAPPILATALMATRRRLLAGG
jgi:hypothetical protein